VPVIVYSPKELTKKEETHLKRLAQTMVLKDVRSPERLVDEAALFLHRRSTSCRSRGSRCSRSSTTPARAGRQEGADRRRRHPQHLRDDQPARAAPDGHPVGRDRAAGAIEILQDNGDIDVVLMDIMMPDMDGYDTMRAIRKLPSSAACPIIAVTAKAMKGDRETCIEAGRRDYISKPVDTRAAAGDAPGWLYR
jgi:CheY-like chemotaxis protein